MFSISIAATLMLIGSRFCQAWLNEVDKEFSYECPNQETLADIRSDYDDDVDRRWNFDCHTGETTLSDDCTWEKVSDDRNAEFNCPNDGIIAGFDSEPQRKEIRNRVWSTFDRSWNVKCCKAIAHTFYGCKWTEVTDHYRIAGQDLVMGMRKMYNEDGWEGMDGHKFRYFVRTCRGTECTLNSVKILEDVGVSKTSRSLVSMATSFNCEDNAEVEFQEGNVEGLEESTEVTTTSSSAWSIGASVTVEQEWEGLVWSAGISASLAYTSTSETSESETLGSSSAFTSTTASLLRYRGPGAALSLSEVDKYQTTKSDVSAQYQIECGNGVSYTQNSTVGLDTTSYGKTHFRSRIATFANKTACINARPHVESCIKLMNIGSAQSHADITDQYENCFIVNGVAVATLEL